MNTYNYLIHKYQKIFNENDLSLEMVKAFLFELCNEYNINFNIEIDNEVDERVLKRFNEGIERLINNEPMNYVLGYSYFYGYKINFNKNVLIPRYETEELVGLILSKYDEYFKGKEINLCDVGTGSGAIAIALKKEEDKFNIYASDISLEALEVAKKNAENNECNINFLHGSMLEPYTDNNLKFDILVSNPPYIKSDEVLETSVYDYEPHVALFGGDDGLKFYKEIFMNAHKILNDNALLFFEIGYDQKDRLTDLAKQYFPNSLIEVYKDINNKYKMLFIKNN